MEKFINIAEILKDLEELKKNVYLESPEIYVDLADKIAENQLDEMILFFATKYNYFSIVKFIIENEAIDLNATSKNNTYKNIKEHILKAAAEFGAKDIHEYILNLNKNNDEENTKSKDNRTESENTESKDTKSEKFEDSLETFIKDAEEKLSDLFNQIDLENIENLIFDTPNENNIKVNPDILKKEDANETQEDTESGYKPQFICPNCNCNLLELGYSTLYKANYKYSQAEKMLKLVSKEEGNSVTCSNCGYTIEQLTPAFLENICTIQNCKACGKDLTSIGIITKLKTEYNSESNTFVTAKKSYHCAECDEELTDYQVNYFKL